MSYELRKTVRGLDGKLHDAFTQQLSGRHRVNGGPWVSGPPSTMIDLAVTADGRPWVLLSDWTPDTPNPADKIPDGFPVLVRPDGSTRRIGDFAPGAYGAALEAVGNTVLVHVRGQNGAAGPDRTWFKVYDEYGQHLPTRDYTGPYAPSIHRVEAGVALTDVDPRRQEDRTINGERFRNCDSSNGWTVGHPQEGGDIGGVQRSVLAVLAPDGRRWMLPYATDASPRDPHIAELDGDVQVSMSSAGPTPEPKDWLAHALPFKAWVERPRVPHVVTDFVPPVLPETLPAVWFGGCCGAPGNFQAGYRPGDSRPVLEQISRWREFYQADMPADVSLLCGYLGSDDGADYTDQEIAAVKSRPDGRAIFVHVDDPAHQERMEAVARQVEAAGLTAILGGHVIPQRQPWGMTVPWHFGWNGRDYTRSPEQMTHELAAKLQTLTTVPGCVVINLFGWDRKGGQQHCPALKQFASDLAARIQTPALKPGERPKPVLVPSVQPTAVPRVEAKPKLPKLTWAELFRRLFRRKAA